MSTILRRIAPQPVSTLAVTPFDCPASPPDGPGTKLLFGYRGNTWDKGIIQSVVCADEYKMKDYGGPRRTVLDVGAHIGSFCTMMQRIWGDARVIALEAAHFNVPVLSHNLTYAPQTEAFYNAIGSVDGEVVTVTNGAGKNTGGNSTRSALNAQSGESTQTVRLVTLARELQVEQFDVVKLDCEGGEHALLADAESAALLAKSAYVTAEIHGRIAEAKAWFDAHFAHVTLVQHPNCGELALLTARHDFD